MNTLTLLCSSSFASYLVRPSPFSAQKTFERHNSRRKSNISFCSNINLAAAAAGSRRGSGIGLNTIGGPQPMSGYVTPRAPPLVTTKSNSLSLPDSPNAMGQMRGRSNSLRVSQGGDEVVSLSSGINCIGSFVCLLKLCRLTATSC